MSFRTTKTTTTSLLPIDYTGLDRFMSLTLTFYLLSPNFLVNSMDRYGHTEPFVLEKS